MSLSGAIRRDLVRTCGDRHEDVLESRVDLRHGRSLPQVDPELAEIAREDARAFDTRNANTVVSDQIEEFLALRAVVDPAERLKAIADRSAEEQLSGLTVFGPVSERRADACAAALTDRLDELSDRSRVRARIVLASMLRATDPVAAVRELRDEAAAARDSYPAMAAQAELMADMTAVAVGTANFIDPATPLRVIDGIRDYLVRHQMRGVAQLTGSLAVS